MLGWSRCSTYFLAVWSSISIRLSAEDKEGDGCDWTNPDPLMESLLSFVCMDAPKICSYHFIKEFHNCTVNYIIVIFFSNQNCKLVIPWPLPMLSILVKGNWAVVDINIRLLSPEEAMLWLLARVDPPCWPPLWNKPEKLHIESIDWYWFLFKDSIIS